MMNISNKVKLIVFLICVIVLISTVNTTYSRYVSASSGVVTTNLARWQIFVNNANIVENYDTSMTFVPVIEQNDNVAANKIAPSSKGYFDIFINPSNVDVSFTYDIAINIPEDSLIKDIKVTDYAIVEGDEITDDTEFEKNKVENSVVTDTLLYDNSKLNFSFNPFIIRMYFSWIDDENETMNDTEDSNIGNMIANGEDTKFELGVNISFKQYVGEDIDNESTNNGDTTLEDDSTENLENPESPDESGEAINEENLE